MIARGFVANGATSVCIVDIVAERLNAVKDELEDLVTKQNGICSITT